MNPSQMQQPFVGGIGDKRAPQMIAGPSSVPGLANDVTAFQQATECLAEHVERLVHKLEPLCQPAPPKNTATGGGLNTSRSPLGQMFVEHVVRLEYLSQTLSELYARLEV